MPDGDEKDFADWANHTGEFGPGRTGSEQARATRPDFSERPEHRTSSVVRYADEAMYKAEPIPSADASHEPGQIVPSVTLVSMTPNPLRVMAAACQMYKGHVVRDPASVPRDIALMWLTDMSKTRLNAGLEFIDLHFFLEGVTRAFTHQLVRQRTAVYVQESLRFAVKDNAAFEVALPPSLWSLKDDDPTRVIWDSAAGNAAWAYNALINAGVPAEDARGLLPTNITTRVHYKTNLRNLLDHAGNRLCTQAQFEWRLVFAGIAQAIRDYPHADTNAWREGERRDQWQLDAIADLFKPICYTTGKCEFKGSADRYCAIRYRVDEHERLGQPSTVWVDISPAEWMTDPAAARRRPDAPRRDAANPEGFQ